jgi:hypothetical protein
LLRLIQSAHALRLEASGSPVPERAGSLRVLADGMDRALDAIATALATNAPLGELPPLRALHEATPTAELPPGIQIELDELVDVINTLGELLRDRQLEPVTT